MNQLKYGCIISFAFLTACSAPKVIQTTEPQVTPQAATPTETTPPTETTTAEGKATTTPTPATATTTTPSSFTLSGAIAAKTHRKGWTATINWAQQSAGQYQIRIIGPLGSQAMMIDKNNGAVTYREGAKKVTSNNADELLQKQTGIRLPVHNLYYWVRGVPAPGAVQSASRDQSNHLTTLKQAGYTINYESYMPVGNRMLPSKIRLQGHDVTIKLIIKRWS